MTRFGSARSLLVATALTVGACSFHVSSVQFSIVGDAGVDLGVDDGGGTGDLAMEPPTDLAGLCTQGGPQSGCSLAGDALLACMGGVPVSTKCDDGCSESPSPHCKQLDPGGVAAPSDYSDPTLVDIVIPADTTAVFNTDTGAISIPDRQGGPGIVSGIGFRQAAQPGGGPMVGIFSAKSITVAANGQISVIGAGAISLVTSGDITISGEIDVTGSCDPGSSIAGGGLGGSSQASAGGGIGGGKGGTESNVGAGGGGGGGYGDVGGVGADSGLPTGTGGAAGARFGDLSAADPVLFGGGGGGAGGSGPASTGGAGGSGGGALQLASNRNITLGSTAIIQASGCHGSPGSPAVVGGGGGGAGGTVLIEGRQVQINGSAIIATNGGAGAGGGAGSGGEDGHDNADVAVGGPGSADGSAGGNGGHTGSLVGDPGAMATSSQQGGGGGGAVGRIALKSKSGKVVTTNAILSPQVGEQSQGHPAPAVVGSVQFE